MVDQNVNNVNNVNNVKIAMIIGATLLVAIVLFGLRWSSSIQTKGPVFDEQYITVPINNIIRQGWSVETAIDFQETKGPAMIWPYAFFGKIMGGTLNDLRVISVWCSIIGLAILSWIAVKCSLYRNGVYFVAIGWLLLPYNIVFSEIVMGESSFLLLSLLAVAIFVWGNEDAAPSTRRWIAPLLYCLVVAIALHSRIHIVALAGGICFTAWAIHGKKSWPWWVASIVAGLLRIPLWQRWGGLVGSDYQSLHGLGFRLESLTYLAAALVPLVGVFAVASWKIACSRVPMLVTFFVGFGLAMIAMPDLTIPDSIDFLHENERYQGIVATFVKAISSKLIIQKLLLGALAGLGLAGLVGLWHNKQKSMSKSYLLVHNITFWSLTFGWLLYALTRGFVFDRFLLTWAFLLPIIWIRALPIWLIVLQYAALTVIAARLTAIWLM